MNVESKTVAVKKAVRINPFRVIVLLITNKYWSEYVLGMVTTSISSAITMGSAVFYAQYILGDAYSYSLLSTALYIAMFIGVISTSVFIKKLGKRNTAIIGLSILIIGTVLAGVLPHTVSVTAITLAIRGFGIGFPTAVGSAILQDTLTYGKWKTGVDMVGMGNAAGSFTAKLSGGLGTAIIGWVLSAGGFDSNIPVQSADAQSAISALFIWIPLIFIAISLVCFIAYKLDKEYGGYVADLSDEKYGPKAIIPNDNIEQDEE
jgi:GPH family glycoside/pentoside/hexuronide:cation symporter